MWHMGNSPLWTSQSHVELFSLYGDTSMDTLLKRKTKTSTCTCLRLQSRLSFHLSNTRTDTVPFKIIEESVWECSRGCILRERSMLVGSHRRKTSDNCVGNRFEIPRTETCPSFSCWWRNPIKSKILSTRVTRRLVPRPGTLGIG